MTRWPHGEIRRDHENTKATKKHFVASWSRPPVRTSRLRSARHRFQQRFRSDRQLPHTDAGRMIDRVPDRRAHAGGRELADAARAEWARVRVELLDELHVQIRNVEVDGHEIAREVLRQIA